MNDQTVNTDKRPVNNPIEGGNRNPYTLWFVVLSFVAPAVLAYVMFFFVEIESFNNHGEILDPIVHIKDFKLKDDAGEIIPQDELTYKWRLISILHSECDDQCAKRLYDTRQIHTSLGKYRHRVYRMFIHLEPASQSLKALIAESHPDVIHVNGDAVEIKSALGENIREGFGIDANETYIMDPMGNVMMRFTQDQPNKDFLYDMRKLLKASQIG